jgi:hypothetical protein
VTIPGSDISKSIKKGTVMLWAKPTHEGSWDRGIFVRAEGLAGENLGEVTEAWTMILAYHHMRLECAPWDLKISTENATASYYNWQHYSCVIDVNNDILFAAIDGV